MDALSIAVAAVAALHRYHHTEPRLYESLTVDWARHGDKWFAETAQPVTVELTAEPGTPDRWWQEAVA